MMIKDNMTGRLMTPEAQAALSKFREGGGKPFHLLELETLRTSYETNCQQNGFPRQLLARVRDYQVGDITVRLYQPQSPRNETTPAILFAHGGGWVMGSLETHDGLCRELALRTGFPVIAVDYRLAPEHRFPTAYEDVLAAFQWLQENNGRILDYSGIVLAGDSAGGQLVASLAVADSNNSSSSILGQVLLYPVTDVYGESPVKGVFTEGLPLVDETMKWFIDAYTQPDTDLADPRLSPARADIGPYCPPAFIVSVDLDPLAADGSVYVQALIQAGADVEFRHIQGVPHGIFTSGGVYSVAGQVLDDVAQFVVNLAPTTFAID